MQLERWTSPAGKRREMTRLDPHERRRFERAVALAFPNTRPGPTVFGSPAPGRTVPLTVERRRWRTAIRGRAAGASSVLSSDVEDCFPSIGERAIRLAAAGDGGDPAPLLRAIRRYREAGGFGSRSVRPRPPSLRTPCCPSPTSVRASPGACPFAGSTTWCSPATGTPSLAGRGPGVTRSSSSACGSTRANERRMRSMPQDRPWRGPAVASCAGREIPLPRGTRAHVRPSAYRRLGPRGWATRRARRRRRSARRRPGGRSAGRDDRARLRRLPCPSDESRRVGRERGRRVGRIGGRASVDRPRPGPWNDRERGRAAGLRRDAVDRPNPADPAAARRREFGAARDPPDRRPRRLAQHGGPEPRRRARHPGCGAGRGRRTNRRRHRHGEPPDRPLDGDRPERTRDRGVPTVRGGPGGEPRGHDGARDGAPTRVRPVRISKPCGHTGSTSRSRSRLCSG